MTATMLAPVGRGTKARTGPEPRIESIGPKRANELLATNRVNRNVRTVVVERYASDMASGRWMFNGAPIIVSDTGILLDGQHRLLAIIESSAVLPFVVLYDAPESTRDTVDQGSPRTAADILSFAGVPDSAMVAAVARVVLARLAGAHNTTSCRPSNLALRKWVLDHPLVMHAAAVAMRARLHVPASPSIVGAAYFLCAEKDDVAADKFFITRLIDLEGLSSTDPARVLHKRLAEMPKSSDGSTKGDQLAYILAAWNLDRDGRKVTKLQSPKGGWSRTNFPDPK